MSSCMSAWPWRPTPMQPKSMRSLGAGRPKTDDGTMAGATAAAAADLRNDRRDTTKGFGVLSDSFMRFSFTESGSSELLEF